MYSANMIFSGNDLGCNGISQSYFRCVISCRYSTKRIMFRFVMTYKLTVICWSNEQKWTK